MSNYICNIRCSYRQPSGYCGSTGGYETCQYRQLHSKQTNADRIRSMTDEELAALLNEAVCPIDQCPHYYEDRECTKSECKKCWLDWLKQGVEE